MALNLELKIQINSHDEIIAKVLKNKGEFVHTLFQKDTYYDFKKGILNYANRTVNLN
jgi:adenylate cyclase class IV